MKIINFDLDGTIVDLYGVENWLTYLTNEDSTPYEVATPMLNLSLLARLIHKVQANGYEVNVISWLAKNSTKEYDIEVETTKRKWLKKHLPSVKFDNVYIVPYGTPKHELSQGILFDDEEKNRSKWKGISYQETQIISTLKALV